MAPSLSSLLDRWAFASAGVGFGSGALLSAFPDRTHYRHTLGEEASPLGPVTADETLPTQTCSWKLLCWRGKFKNYLFKPASTQLTLSCQNSSHECRSVIERLKLFLADVLTFPFYLASKPQAVHLFKTGQSFAWWGHNARGLPWSEFCTFKKSTILEALSVFFLIFIMIMQFLATKTSSILGFWFLQSGRS